MLNFESVKSIIANPYVIDSMKIVSENNPLNYKDEKQKKSSKPKATLSLLNALGLFSNKDKK
jgi:hypothetical protein